MAEISLGKSGKYAIVDDEDFEMLSSYKWYLLKDTYAYCNSKPSLMHRLIMDSPKGLEVDHINGNGLDNRRSNLRLCTHKENSRNRKVPINSTSGHSGVWFEKPKKLWRAVIRVDGRVINLGRSKSKSIAIERRRTAELRYFGSYTRKYE